MNRLITAAGRTLRYTVEARKNFRLGVSYPAAYLNTRYSTKASELRSVLPKLWITKMKTGFAWLDTDGDGYISENDFLVWEKEMNKSLPDASKEQRELLAATRKAVWENLFGGKGKGPNFKMTEDLYIETWFNFTTQDGSESMLKKEFENTFAALDINNDGLLSKAEHQIFFNTWKNPVGSIVAFTAIDANQDGIISRDEFTQAGIDFFFNFTDEGKPGNYMFGPLRY